MNQLSALTSLNRNSILATTVHSWSCYDGWYLAVGCWAGSVLGGRRQSWQQPRDSHSLHQAADMQFQHPPDPHHSVMIDSWSCTEWWDNAAVSLSCSTYIHTYIHMHTYIHTVTDTVTSQQAVHPHHLDQCRMTNYELLRWLVETPSRDVEHYRMLNVSAVDR